MWGFGFSWLWGKKEGEKENELCIQGQRKPNVPVARRAPCRHAPRVLAVEPGAAGHRR